MLEKEIAAIAATGVKVIVSGGKIGDLCLHYLNKYNIMAVRLNSKFDLRRLCKSINATALPRLVWHPFWRNLNNLMKCSKKKILNHENIF